MKRLNRKSVSPPPPPLGRHAPAPYFHLLFLIFQIPPPAGEVIKIYSPLYKKMGEGGGLSKLC